jgi:hypothetical protein
MTIRALAKELNCNEWDLYNDWKNRESWLPKHKAGEATEKDVADMVAKFDELVSECWRVLREVRERGGLNALNGALKNLRETLVAQSQLLQSIGYLPKVASEQKIEVKSEQIEFDKVDYTEEEWKLLSEAMLVIHKLCPQNKNKNSIH